MCHIFENGPILSGSILLTSLLLAKLSERTNSQRREAVL